MKPGDYVVRDGVLFQIVDVFQPLPPLKCGHRPKCVYVGRPTYSLRRVAVLQTEVTTP